MKKLEICKACLLVMEEGKFEICPACGVKKSAFEPYTERVDISRKKIIDLHLHPISVHFPQAFSVIALQILLLKLFIPDFVTEKLLFTADIMIYFFPLAVIFSFVTGVLDGYIRFKSLSPPYLKGKMIVSASFFIFTLVSAYITYVYGNNEMYIYNIILLALSLGCQVYLGKIGIHLMYSILPGKMKSKAKKTTA